ncbi:hypothetical protein ASF28_09120 [Methylobacterium sp. Leaf99]|uniref:hypothetical protein n=1 Tax=Methylobacterium sp. Leaf99 TaxID=1736251 RepID=UPI0006FEBCB0|nr:hypothetical protein [Methylobacterium sp. Leaf99]KQP11195.1 hypothetical protein ASF28_09120 [Methylobacterium sp. Leaf99]
MTEPVEHHAPERPDPILVVDICDRGLIMAGLPTYSDLAERLKVWEGTAAARLEAATLGTAIAETRRLRTAHGIVGTQIGAAMAAFAVGDAQAGMNILNHAKEFCDHHAVQETAQPQPENVVLLAAHRVQCVAADLGRL